MHKVHVAFASLALTLILSDTACVAQTKASPSALGEEKSASFAVRLSSNSGPPVRGYGEIEAVVADAGGKPVSDAHVSFDLDMTNMHMGKNVVEAVSQGDGRYVGKARFSMPGPWRIIVRVARLGQAPEDVRFDFNVKFR